MPGKPWTNNDVDILKDRLLDGLKRGDPEKATLSQISKILKRTYVAVRFHYDRLRLEDQDFNTSVLEILNARAQKKKEEADVETAEADYGREYINIVCSSRRITTVPMAIKHFQIDMNEWEVDRYKIKTSEGYRKDRQVEWEVTEGFHLHGCAKFGAGWFYCECGCGSDEKLRENLEDGIAWKLFL